MEIVLSIDNYLYSLLLCLFMNSSLILIYILFFIFAIIVLNWDKIIRIFFPTKDKTSEIGEKDSTYICPNCGDTNVVPDLTREMIAHKGITRLRCKNCDFSAPGFLKIPKSKVSEYKKRILNKSEETKEWLSTISSSKGIIPKILIDREKEKRKSRNKKG